MLTPIFVRTRAGETLLAFHWLGENLDDALRRAFRDAPQHGLDIVEAFCSAADGWEYSLRDARQASWAPVDRTLADRRCATY